MEWLKKILEGLENAEALEKSIAEGIGKNFVSKADFNAANEAKKKLETQVTDLQKTIDNGEDFKKQYEDLKKEIDDERAEAQRKADEAAEEAAMSERFKSVVGEQKWRDELTEKAVYSEFKNALNDEANKGKGDKDILEALTKDKEYFAKDPSKTPAFSRGTGFTGGGSVDDAAARAAMGLPPKKD